MDKQQLLILITRILMNCKMVNKSLAILKSRKRPTEIKKNALHRPFELQTFQLKPGECKVYNARAEW